MDIRKNLWVYRYTPKTFEEIILNEEIKPKLRKALNDLPNMLLYGTAGIGKGCFANILKEQENVDYMWINGSDENGVDVFRNKITPFASAMCLPGKMKVVIINEADALTSGQSGSQKLMRQLIEDTNHLCRFVLLCNYEGNIIPELKSRFKGYTIKFDNPPKKEIGKLCLKILRKEKVKFESKDVIDIINKCFPDIRGTIEVLQANVIDGKLVGSKVFANEELFEKILDYILKSDIEKVREELRSNYIQYEYLYEYLYNEAGRFSQPGKAILNIGKFLYQDSTIVNKEINFITMVVSMIYEKVI